MASDWRPTVVDSTRWQIKHGKLQHKANQQRDIAARHPLFEVLFRLSLDKGGQLKKEAGIEQTGMGSILCRLARWWRR